MPMNPISNFTGIAAVSAVRKAANAEGCASDGLQAQWDRQLIAQKHAKFENVTP